jgi:hypothetical protein
MKAHLIFDLSKAEERKDHELALKASEMKFALEEIANQIFRPARKHGYQDQEIETLRKKLGEKGNLLIDLLEGKFFEILNERDIKLFE